jgi:hypothetical protein
VNELTFRAYQILKDFEQRSVCAKSRSWSTYNLQHAWCCAALSLPTIAHPRETHAASLLAKSYACSNHNNTQNIVFSSHLAQILTFKQNTLYTRHNTSHPSPDQSRLPRTEQTHEQQCPATSKTTIRFQASLSRLSLPDPLTALFSSSVASSS